MKRYFLWLVSLLLLSGLAVGCSSDDTDTSSSENSDDTTEVESSDSSGENGADATSLGIELRSHDFDEAEEVVEDIYEKDTNFQKSGTNLTLPDGVPSDFPIPEGMSIDTVIIRDTDDPMGNLELWFNDGGNYTIEQMYALYEGYIQNSGFEDVEVKDFNHYMTGLMSYEGIRDDIEYIIGVNPEEDHNVMTLATYNN